MAGKKMSADRLKFFEELILREREESLKIIRSISESQSRGAKDSAGDLSSYSLHQADQGSDTHSMENQVYNLEQEQEKIKLLNQSLKKIYDGTYGVCEICGEMVSEARLEVIPYARYCIECMNKEEKKKSRR